MKMNILTCVNIILLTDRFRCQLTVCSLFLIFKLNAIFFVNWSRYPVARSGLRTLPDEELFETGKKCKPFTSGNT